MPDLLSHVFMTHCDLELERSFEGNQKTFVMKAEELDRLESEARNVLQELNQKVAIFSTCA